ncbi:MAG: hypothetical protein WDO15_03890 [Bacteroidota bacterium]
MRGVVSLAAALAIPVYVSEGVPFPQRNLILFITFIVILTTLIVQGLTLPYFIRKLDTPYMHDTMPDEEAHEFIRKNLNDHTLSFLRSNYQDQARYTSAVEQNHSPS